MTEQTPSYRKFPAKKRKFLGSDRLWISDDHLLLVASTGISEEYKRFYFKDIQAFNILKTGSNTIGIAIRAILLALILLLTAWLYIETSHEPALLLPGGICALAVAISLGWTVIKGPSCKTFIYSSVQKELLTPLSNQKNAQKFLKTVVPKIENIQGAITAQDLESGRQRVTAAPDKASPGQTGSQKQIKGTWHGLLFICLISLSGFSAAMLLYQSMVLFFLVSLIFMAGLLMNTIALVRQAGSSFSSSLKAVTISGAVFLGLSAGLGYFEFFYFMFKEIENGSVPGTSQWEMVKLFGGIDYMNYPIIAGANLFLAVLFMVLGLSGLILLRQERKG